MAGMLSVCLLVSTVLVLLRIPVATGGGASVTPGSSASPPFQSAAALNLTCNSNFTNATYEWNVVCPEGQCFPLFNPSSRVVSTLDRPRVKALTAVDNGNYTCTTTSSSDAESAAASIEIKVKGVVGVFDGVSLSTVSNNSYFTADSSGYLNVELHCIGDTGEGWWLTPTGILVYLSGGVFNVESLYGSSILVQTNGTIPSTDESGDGSTSGTDGSTLGTDGSASSTDESEVHGSGQRIAGISMSLSPFNDSSLEGYYQCKANEETDMINIGFFLNGRAPPLVNSLNASSNPVLLETEVSLTCDAYPGVPSATYTWYHNGNYLRDTDDPSLTINITDADQYGNYTCTATNKVGTDSQTLLLEQGFLPQITGGAEDVSVTTPQPYVIDCAATGYPLPSLSVNYPGGRYTNSSSVVKYNVSVDISDPSQSGVYTCNATNIFGSVFKNFTVFVSVAPTVSVEVDHFVVVSGESLSITCNATGVPLPDVFLETPDVTYNSSLITDNTGLMEKILTVKINKTTPADTGLYMCVAINTAGSDNVDFTITVQYAPEVIIAATNLTIIYNYTHQENASFHCTFDGEPTPSITWLSGGIILASNSEHYEISTTSEDGSSISTLVILDIEPADSGLYTCNGSNALGYSVSSANLIINALPLAFTDRLHYIVNLNQDISITCSAAGVPVPMISWFSINEYGEETMLNDYYNEVEFGKVSETPLSNGLYQVNQTISGVLNMSYTGRYLCEAVNAIGTGKTEFNITVQYAPMIIEEAKEVTVIYSQQENASFSCTVMGEPKPTIAWLKGTTIILGSDKYKISTVEEDSNTVSSTLVILDIKPTDSGLYTCNGSNALGYDTSQANLIVNVVPNITEGPQNVTTIQPNNASLSCSSTGIPAPNIAWYKMEDSQKLLSGDNQNYTIEYIGSGNFSASSSLIVLNSDPFDDAVYLCNASNVAGYTTATSQITVFVKPFISSDQEIYTVNETKPVSFECSATGIPSPMITWYRNGTLISNETDSRISITQSKPMVLQTSLLYQTNQTMTINDTTDTDTDMYFCTANTDGVGLSTDEFELIVNYATRLSAGITNHTVLEHSNFMISCQVEGRPRPSVQWWFSSDGSEYSELTSSDDDSPRVQESFEGFSVTSMLLIGNISRSFHGYFKCNSSNSLGSIESVGFVTVNFNTFVLAGPAGQTVVSPNNVTFLCTVEGRPRPIVRWVKGDTMLSTDQDYTINLLSDSSAPETLVDSSLTIASVVPLDAGDYICAASGLTNASSSAVLTVYVIPVILAPLPNQTFTVNQSDPVTMACSSTGLPAPDLTWLRQGEEIMSTLGNRGMLDTPTINNYSTPDGTVYLTEQSLSINSTNGSDTGVFACTANNTPGNTTVYFNLFVQVPPIVVSVDGDRHIISIEESETVIEFSVVNAAPDVSPGGIQWIFSEHFTEDPYSDYSNIDITNSISGRYSFSDDNRQLTISNVNQTDEGRYYLIATNPAGVHYNHIDIIVHGPPKLFVGPSDQTVIDSSDVIFVCEAVADPLHNVSWLHNQNTSLLTTKNDEVSDKYSLNRNSTIVSAYGTLMVHNVQYSDRGQYLCVVDNYIATVTTSAVLTVHVVPVIHAVSPSLSENISEPLTLYCVVTGYPKTEFTWSKNGEQIETNTLGVTKETVPFSGYANENLPDLSYIDSSISYVGLLKFNSLTRNDTAQYVCTATNELSITGIFSNTSVQITITVLERPDPPTNVTVTSYAKRTVDLSWQPAFDGNRDIVGYQVYLKDYDDQSDQFTLVSSTFFTTTATFFKISSEIIPYTKYVFKVLACNVIGCTDISEATPSDPIRTLPDAPSSPPTGCSAQADSSTSMTITWGVPDQPNGLMERYQVSYYAEASVYSSLCVRTGSGRVNTSDNSTSLSLPDLLKGTYYSFSIVAYTLIGAGPPSDNTTCIYSTLLNVPDALPISVISSSPSSTSIKVSWGLPDPCLWNGAITGYSITYNGVVKFIGNESTTTTLTGLKKFTDYIISVSLGTEVGYGPPTIVTRRTLNDTSSVPLSLRVTSRGGDYISLEWKQPAEPNGIISSYRVYYQPSNLRDATYDSSESSITVNSISTEANLTDLYGSTNYTISVTALNGAGESKRSVSITHDTLPAPPPTPLAPSNGSVGANRRQYRITLYRPSSINGIISHYHVVAVLLPSGELPTQVPDIFFPSLYNFTTYEYVINNNGFDSPVGYIVGEFSEEEFPKDSMYTIGNDSAPNDTYENGLLKYDSYFTFFLRAYPLITVTSESTRSVRQVSGRQYSRFSSSGYSEVYDTPKRPTDDSTAVIASVVTVIMLLLLAIVTVVIVVLVIVYFKRRTQVLEFGDSVPHKKEHGEVLSIMSDVSLSPVPSFLNPAYNDNESDMDKLSNQFSGHPPIPVGEFGKIVDRLHANDNYMFSQEYEDICRTSPQPPVDICLNPMNKCRNRYANIQAYDHSRVKLVPVEGHPHDYINANFLSGYNREKEYIATQGPLPDTVSDFWRMVWDHNVTTVVMLTNLVEKMRVKCSQYWPEGVGLTEQYANICVSLTKCVTHADYCIRTFEIRADDTKEVRHVKQFHYLSWPDFGVPRHSTPLLQFLRVVRRNHKYTDTRPMIVHCSAGVGRTGTLCTIDTEMQRAQHEGVISCYSCVRTMRNNRNHMVQTEAQYVFLHDALLEVITTGWTDIGVEQLADRMAELEEEDDLGETGYSNEFSRLKSSQQYISEYSSAMNDANKFKNRIINALPYDHNRVKLKKSAGEEGSDYINASFIDGFKAKNVFIATQGPMENTVDDFWRMAWEQKVSVIVMLCKNQERGQPVCHQYYPLHAGSALNFGPFHIVCNNELVLDDYTQRELKLSYATNEDKDYHVIRHYQYTSWPRSGAPQIGAGMIDLLEQVTRSQQQTGNKPIVVHCSAGVGRTGTFCALSIAVERAKVEQVVNIFDTVKHLRTQRAHMVQTLDQYIFCYRAVLEYVESLSNYANFQTSI